MKPDPLVQLVEQSLDQFKAAAQFGAWLIDIFPSCALYSPRPVDINIDLPLVKYIPTWMPGAHFKRFAQESRLHAKHLVDIPYKFAVSQMVITTMSFTHVVERGMTCYDIRLWEPRHLLSPVPL